MAEALVHVVVLDEGLYTGTGLVHRWLLNVGNRLYQNIILYAPERSGELRAGIGLDFTQGPNLRILESTVESTAPHTKYVIEGTADQGLGYIYTTEGAGNLSLIARMEGGEFIEDLPDGMFLVLSDERGGRHLKVHGQSANNFLLKGYDRTARTHRSLKPIHPGLVI